MSFLFDKWIWKMAWRDGRAHKGRMVLFISCICLGVTALVALRAFGSSVRENIMSQSRSLLGGDLLIKSRQKHPEKLIDRLKEISVADVREWRFASMGKFPDSGDESRLIQVRGVENGFPLYGKVETEPPEAVKELAGEEPAVVIDESLMLQFNVKVGERLIIGNQTFKIAGYLKSLPGEGFIVSELAPRVLVPFKELENTGLLRFGSRVRYRHYFKYKEGVDEKALKLELQDEEIEHGIRSETVDDRQESIDRTLNNLFHFLNLVAFIALILGGIGIGSAIRVHISSKLKNAAILRCLGATKSRAVGIYVTQAIAMGFAGGVMGAVLGSVLAKLLPGILSNFLPVDVVVTLSPKAILLGIGLGLIITLLFSLTPLLKLNKMTAGDSLKSSIDIESVKTKWVWGVWLAIIALILGFSVLNAHKLVIGLGMGGGLIISIGLLVLMAFLLMFLVKKLIPDLLPFVWKQGLKNLYRPQNQTLTAVVSLGLGTFMISILYLSQENLLQQVRSAEEGNSPNMVLFDIQVDQVDQVNEVLKNQGLEAIDTVPIVSMRLKKLNGKDVKIVREENAKLDRKERIPNWTLQRTYRSTYRSKLNSGERILEGNFVPKVDMQDVMDGKIKVPISVESGILENMKLKLGDTMTFDLGGIDIPCVISSVRYVEWMKMRPNFFVVFPDGLLNDAPQMVVAVTKTADSKESAKLQAEITKKFTNISVLDLSLVVKTVQSMLDKASLAVKLMAGFSILTGLVILICSLHLSQLQRLKDNTLLKVLGSSRKQVMSIMFSEFCFLALLGANAGTILAYGANFALSEFVFENHLPINWEVLLMANGILLVLTLSIGFLISRKTYIKTSLEVLREET